MSKLMQNTRLDVERVVQRLNYLPINQHRLSPWFWLCSYKIQMQGTCMDTAGTSRILLGGQDFHTIHKIEAPMACTLIWCRLFSINFVLVYSQVLLLRFWKLCCQIRHYVANIQT